MAFINGTNGTNLFYKDWGTGQPVVFVHGWCINCDSWEYIMQDMTDRGFRCIAYDQRGCGRSDQASDGYDYSTLADDLSALIEHLDLKDVVLVGHSMGCGVITRYLADYGDIRVKKAVLLGTTTPYLIKAEDNPNGFDESFLNDILNFMKNDRPGYVRSLADPFFGFPNPVNPVSADMVDWAVALTLQASLKAAVELQKTIVLTDQRDELGKIDIPVLILHGDKDIGLPLHISATPTHNLLANSKLKILKDQPHGMYISAPALLTSEITQFINEE